MVGDVTPGVAHLRIRASAPSSLLSRFPVFVTSANAITQETFCRLRHVSVQLDCNSLHMCLLSASCHPAQSLFCWSCADSSTHLRWLKTSSWWKKNALHGSGAGSLSTVHTDLLIMEAQVGQLQAQLAQTQTELQYAIEQIRILTLQVNRNTSAVTTAATTTEPTATSAGYHSRMPKVNYQFGKDIIPNIFDGKQRNDFREWAENSALYLSLQCVDACEILLEWLVMEKVLSCVSSLSCGQCERNLTGDVLPSASRQCSFCVFVILDCNSLHMCLLCLLSYSTILVLLVLRLLVNALALAQDNELRKKTCCRKSSRTRSPRGRSPRGRTSRWPCKDYF